MIILHLFPVTCWGIIITKARNLSKARKDSQLFFDAFRETPEVLVALRRNQAVCPQPGRARNHSSGKPQGGKAARAHGHTGTNDDGVATQLGLRTLPH